MSGDRKKARRWYPSEAEEEIIRLMRGKGKGWTEMADILGVNWRSVRHWALNNLGAAAQRHLRRSKLTPETMVQILIDSDKVSDRAQARRYGVSNSTISRIISGELHPEVVEAYHDTLKRGSEPQGL